MSRFRRGAGALVVLLYALASLAVESCNGGKTCTLIGCAGTGLDIMFVGNLAQDTTLQIEVALVEQAVAPIIHCELSSAHDVDAGAPALLCNSNLWISQEGHTLHTHEILATVRVTISSNSTQLSQQDFSPSYTHSEPNGPGCGECNYATIQVALP